MKHRAVSLRRLSFLVLLATSGESNTDNTNTRCIQSNRGINGAVVAATVAATGALIGCCNVD